MLIILPHGAPMHTERILDRPRFIHGTQVRSSRLIHLALAALCVMISSCMNGVYEERQARTRERLAELDREDRLLGEPLTLPPGQGPTLFLRPPQGVGSAPHGSSPAPDWLSLLPWSEPPSLVPPMQLLVGVHRRTEQREELDTIIATDLKTNGVQLQRLPDPGGGRDWIVTQLSEPMATRKPVRYRRLVLQGELTPLGPGSRRPTVPAACVYRYEVFIHEAGDWCVVVVFQLFEREATERLWKAQGIGSGDIRRLPAPDRKLVGEQVEACLASLRVGEAATARWRAWRGG